MPLLFLSHAGVDTDRAVALASAIEATTAAKTAGLKVWVDHRADGPYRLMVGHPWMAQLEDAIAKQSTAFALLLTRQDVKNWVRIEVSAALTRVVDDQRDGRAYPFVPILADDDIDPKALPPFARLYQGVRLTPDGQGLRDLISAAINASGTRPIALIAEPFLGLEAFGSADAALFFGRKQETADLADRFGATNFVVVVGDSGSGKSSLVKAGLVPAFREGVLAERGERRPDSRQWHVVQMRPGASPLDGLADGVARAAESNGKSAAQWGEFRKWVRSGTTAEVRDALADSGPPDASLLLVVDQFEELWTRTSDDDRTAFTKLLLKIAPPGDMTRRVVATMRYDYFGLCVRDEGLKERLSPDRWNGRFILKAMTKRGLREAVENPLMLAGVSPFAATELADEIIKDVAGQPGNLALVQMSLHETWQRRHESGGNLSTAYEKLDRLEGALAHAADEVFSNPSNDPEKLLKTERPIAEALFMRLVRAGDVGGATRRPVQMSELSEAARLVAQKLTTKACRRLLAMVSDDHENGDGAAKSRVELAHEQLVTQWPQYQEWIIDRSVTEAGGVSRADDKRALDRLMDCATRWVALGKARTDLARGADLEDDERLRRNRPLWLSPIEVQFIRASVVARRQTRILAAGMALVLSVVAAAALWQAREARLNLEGARRVLATATWNDLPRERSKKLGPRERNALWLLATQADTIGPHFVNEMRTQRDRRIRFGATAAPITRALGILQPTEGNKVLELLELVATPLLEDDADHENASLAAGVRVLAAEIPAGDQDAIIRVMRTIWRDFGPFGERAEIELAETVAMLAPRATDARRLTAFRIVLHLMKRAAAPARAGWRGRESLAAAAKSLAGSLPSPRRLDVTHIVDLIGEATSDSEVHELVATAIQLDPTGHDRMLREILERITISEYWNMNALAKAAKHFDTTGISSEDAWRLIGPPLLMLEDKFWRHPLQVGGSAAEAVGDRLTPDQATRATAMLLDALRRSAEIGDPIVGRALRGMRVPDFSAAAISRDARSLLNAYLTKERPFEPETAAALGSLLSATDRQALREDAFNVLPSLLEAVPARLYLLTIVLDPAAPALSTAQKAIVFDALWSSLSRLGSFPPGPNAREAGVLVPGTVAALAPFLSPAHVDVIFDQLRDMVLERGTSSRRWNEVYPESLAKLTAFGSREPAKTFEGLRGTMLSVEDEEKAQLLLPAMLILIPRIAEGEVERELAAALDRIERDDARLAAEAQLVAQLGIRLAENRRDRCLDVLKRALAWAPTNDAAIELARAYARLLPHEPKAQFRRSIALALRYPAAAGVPSEVFVRELAEPGGEGTLTFEEVLRSLRADVEFTAALRTAPSCPLPFPLWRDLSCPAP